MDPEKLADLMLLRLNSSTVARYKEQHKFETKFTPAETKGIIRTDLQAMDDPETDFNPRRGGFVEDIVEDLENDEVTVHEVEDNIL